MAQGICSKRQTHRHVYTKYDSMQVPGEPALFPSEGRPICNIRMFMHIRTKESSLVVYISGMTFPITFAWRKTNERSGF